MWFDTKEFAKSPAEITGTFYNRSVCLRNGLVSSLGEISGGACNGLARLFYQFTYNFARTDDAIAQSIQ